MDRSPILTPAQTTLDSVSLRLVRAARAVEARIAEALHRALAALGHPALDPLDLVALAAIGQGGVTAADLARRLGMRRRDAADAVRRLIAAGLVAPPAPRGLPKGRVLALTEAGGRLLSDCDLVLAARDRALLAPALDGAGDHPTPEVWPLIAALDQLAGEQPAL
ncbi:MAG: MarR family transcriptional regulator [Pseudomonadota bacterium]